MIPTGCTEIAKDPTGIPGFDLITYGGLPRNRTVLVSGTAGSAKTVLAAQFLAEGIQQFDHHGVFVTFEETPDDIRKNLVGFGWNIQEWEEEEKWCFVDASPTLNGHTVISGQFDMGALLARIEHAIGKVGAKRVSLDSIGSILGRFPDTHLVRSELLRIAAALKLLNVTALMTSERVDEYGHISRYNVEEFIADNVIILRNTLQDEKRRRTIEVLKFRGTNHQKGEYPFTVRSGEGIVILPLSAMELTQKSTTVRISSGNQDLDNMCGGGFFRDSILLITGATGCGKTLLTNVFMRAGAESQERCLLLAFEESRDQVVRNASGWGINFEEMESDGYLKVICTYPEHNNLEDHLIQIKKLIDQYQPTRLAVDSLSALHRVSSPKGFREFVVGLTSHVKAHQIASLFTSTANYGLNGNSTVTADHISTITDSIILLRYVEFFGEMHRGLTVLKMRGSYHDKQIREFTIDDYGIHIGRPFRHVTGILRGNPQHLPQSEIDRLGALFEEESS
ncbi:MAG: circadian clock protein KaiC [Nitrospirales bacterium]|nr:circadian clock protein KaiC [Nitrospira sp.]MDR4503074.1 circadian clock protein KaiC [Nitrospirales bacterium]